MRKFLRVLSLASAVTVCVLAWSQPARADRRIACPGEEAVASEAQPNHNQIAMVVLGAGAITLLGCWIVAGPESSPRPNYRPKSR